MSDDWRIRIEVPEEHGEGLLDRMRLDLASDEAKRLAKELEGRRLAVSQDDNELFVYASTQQEAEQARQLVEAELAEEGIEGRTSQVERWLHDEERWSNEPAQETWEEEELDRGTRRGRCGSSTARTARPTRRPTPLSARATRSSAATAS